MNSHILIMLVQYAIMSSVHVNETVKVCVFILFLHFVAVFLNSGRQQR
jgi:hypothetical protein